MYIGIETVVTAVLILGTLYVIYKYKLLPKLIKINFYGTYLIIRTPFAIVQQWLGRGKTIFSNGLRWIEMNKKRYAVLFLIILSSIATLLPTSFVPGEMSISALTNIFNLLWIVVASVVILLVIGNIVGHLKLRTKKRTFEEELDGAGGEGHYYNPSSDKEMRNKREMHHQIQHTQEKYGELPSDYQKAIQEVLSVVGSDVKNPGWSNALAAIGWTATILIVQYLILGAYIMTALEFLGVTAFADSIRTFIDPWILWADQMGIVPSIDVNIERYQMMASSAAADLRCLGDVNCYREWAANNTRRPGSEEVGETYRLEIDNFDVNQGQGELNIAFNRPDFAIPFTFRLENTRHDLIGITARDVHYRVSVTGQDRDIDNPYCTTGWRELGDIDPGRAADLGDENIEGQETGQDQLTLEECNMLQPALGIQRDIVVETSYDYFSQSNIDVTAVESENVGETVEPRTVESETARTPVQSYINVEEPIEFEIQEDGSREAQPFRVEFGIFTDENIRYRIPDPESIRIRGSTHTELLEEGQCHLQETDEENVYKLSEERLELFRRIQDEGWFTANDNPPPSNCRMQLTEDELGSGVDAINPAGQTLSMSIESNYTVIHHDEENSFTVQNDECPDYNCPFIVTETQIDELNLDPDNYLTKCDQEQRVDAGDGCTIRTTDDIDNETNEGGWEIIDQTTKEEGFDRIDSGQQAYTWPHPDLEDMAEDDDHTNLVEAPPSAPSRDRFAFGLEPEEMEQLQEPNLHEYPGTALIKTVDHQGNEDVQMEHINPIFCENADNTNYQEVWEDEHGVDTEVLFFNPMVIQCDEQGFSELYGQGVEEHGISNIDSTYSFGNNNDDWSEAAEEIESIKDDGCDTTVSLERHLGPRCYNR